MKLHHEPGPCGMCPILHKSSCKLFKHAAVLYPALHLLTRNMKVEICAGQQPVFSQCGKLGAT
eukprot:1006887-Pelagomonas_calceolata.AAC.4